jgi:hypothetical protein
MSYQPNPIVSEIPADDADSVAVAARALPQHVSRIGFTKSLSNTVDPDWGTIVGGIGSGMDVDQTGGNLVITSGTTIRSETIIRSNASWKGGTRLRIRNTLSQRIINQNFFVELVDVIGDNLAYSIGSATAITVTIPANPFTAENVGQSMYIGLFSGTGTFLGGRYPIASVSGNDVTFTVSGFAAGTGTCSLFGWNYYQLQYQGTNAGNVNYDTQRNGWASGATVATINTTASPGHLAILTSNDLTSTLSDQLVASATTIAVTPRASRVENVPDDVALRLQIRVQNLATAPASSTTWTIGLISISNFAPQDISIQDIRPTTISTGLPVEIVRGATLTANTNITAGQTVHSSAATGAPVRVSGRVVPTTIATQDVTLVAGDASDVGITSGQQLIIKEGGTSELDFTIPVSSTATVVTVQGLVASPAQASVRNYVKSIRVRNNTLGAAGTLLILDSIVSVTSIAITTGLVTTGTHDLRVGDAIIFTALASGTGVNPNQIYYVTTVGSATTFNFSATPGGANVVPSVAYTGTSMYRVFDQFVLDTVAGTQQMTYNQPLKGIANTIMNFLLPTSLVTGNVYITVNGYRGF